MSTVLRPAAKDATSKSQTSRRINEDLGELEVNGSSSGITVSSLEETAEQMLVELERKWTFVRTTYVNEQRMS